MIKVSGEYHNSSWDQGLPWKPVQMAKDNWEMPGWEELLQAVKFGL